MIAAIVLMIVVNALANALPINGQNTGEISDRFDVYFTPAGYVFSIWGLIYLGLIAYAVYQALPAQRENPRLRRIGWWVVIGSLANTAWIFLWHYEVFPLTLPVMLVLLLTLIVIYLSLGINRVKVSTAERQRCMCPSVSTWAGSRWRRLPMLRLYSITSNGMPGVSLRWRGCGSSWQRCS